MPSFETHDDSLVRARTTIGEHELTILNNGSYYLDGGAMFGVVPKTMWEKRLPVKDNEGSPAEISQ